MPTIAMMSRLSAATGLRPLQPRAAWTLVGASAIPLWALWPLFAASTSGGMPLFQFLTIMHGVAALTLFALHRPARSRRSPDDARQFGTGSLLPPFMVMFGILFSNILFVMAIGFVPPAQANLIVYLWPLEIVVLAAVFGLVSLRRNHLLALALGFAGAAVVVGPTNVEVSWFGTGLALEAVWSGQSTASTAFGRGRPPVTP